MKYNYLFKLPQILPRAVSTLRDNIRVISRQTAPKKGPFGAVWNINNVCNAKCSYCDYWTNTPSARDKDLSLSQKKQIIKTLAHAGVCSLSFCNGEPLLTKELPELISHAKKNKMLVNISTNGALLKERSDELIQSRIDFITVSVESHISGIHDSIRGTQGLFNKIREGIESIREKRRDKNPYIAVRTLINRKTIFQLDEYIKYWKDKVDEIILKPIMNRPKFLYKIPANMEFGQNDKSGFEKYFSSLLKKYKFLDTPYNRGIITYLFNPGSLPDKHLCFSGTAFVDIDYQGNISPCMETTDTIGNILNADFMELWTSDKMRDFRARLAKDKICDCWTDRLWLSLMLQKILKFQGALFL